MSCSKTSAVNYMISKKLVKRNMELYTPLPTLRLSKTIDRLTSLAKTTYGVDMGPLFSLRYRDLEVGNYLTLGSAAVETRILLIPNDSAFEAIDRSPAQERLNRQRQLDERRYNKLGEVTTEYITGETIADSDGSIPSPTSLPTINVLC